MDIQELLENFNFTSTIWQITTPLILSLCDIISGYIQAIINHNVDSQKMRKGLWHKILVIMVIILSFILQFTFNLPYLSRIVCIYVIVMEAVSILENLKKAGINIGKLTDFIKEKTENNTNESIDKLVNIIEETKKDN